ncbi:MAG: pirin family protein [Alphaproteobacteria bacterium]|nr:pirin family protein [Alphaproteobacteria bacterium]
MTQRTLSLTLQPPARRHGGGLVTSDLGGGEIAARLDPFIMVSLYEMAAPTFPPHPHAGFSVATYILPESPIGFFNQDTLGNKNRIAPGALHVTVAGSGVQHEEQPERLGSIARGYQIWIDHDAAEREVAPHALHLSARDVPRVQRDGATVRIVLGESNGVASPLTPPTPVRLIDVDLEKGARFEQHLRSAEAAFVFVLSGAIEVAGVTIPAGAVALTARDGDELVVTAPTQAARFTVFAGAPLKSPRVQGGPFVAASQAQLQRFASRFKSGGFGALTPFAAQPDWAPND